MPDDRERTSSTAHARRTDLLDRARQAVERGDYAEAHALATIALADAGDELTAWVALIHEDVTEGINGVTDSLGHLEEWAEYINAGIGVLADHLPPRQG